MAKFGTSRKFNTLVRKFQKSFLMGHGKKLQKPNPSKNEEVKEGHFAVIAANGEKPQKFVVPLTYLTHPIFIRLLEQAAEEYGFRREGALEIPCRAVELECLLAQRWQSCC